jgi:ABC-type lipoprotein export system ATPase subunit
MITLRGIAKTFNPGRSNAFTAVRRIDLTIEQHTVSVLRGPSGSGKSTLLSIIGCMTRPTQGRLVIDGQNATSLPEPFLACIRRQTFGFVFQNYNLIQGLSVLDNTLLPAYPAGEPYGTLRPRAMAILEQLHIEDKYKQRVEHLSGGEQQRAAIARALINDPIVLIADEPTAHLDTALAADFLDMLADLKSQGRTVVLASHDPLVCTHALVDTVLDMRDGQLVTGGAESLMLSPAIIALALCGGLIAGYAVYAAGVGWQIIQHWDLNRSDSRQLAMERRTYLVSTIFSYLLFIECFSLLFFIYTADHMHPLFVGAMCAAGTLNVNAFGYPTLWIKLINVLLCGGWLMVNWTDQQVPGYPLIRFKYKLLLPMAILLVLENLLQLAYFKGLQADIITSCCGTLFSEDAASIAGEIASLHPAIGMTLFFVSFAVMVRCSIYYLLTGRQAILFAYAGIWFFAISLMAILSFISVYFYQMPTHHCPFDILQKEYHFVGYPLYITLVSGGIFSLGAGLLNRFKTNAAMADSVNSMQNRAAKLALISYTLFTAISVYPILFSHFKLIGY